MLYPRPVNNDFLCKIHLDWAKPYIRGLHYKTVCGFKFLSCCVELESLIL